jgi:prophage DNA circulation protein
MSCPTVTTIQKTECIGNSLVTINSNFATLKDAACDNQSQINGLNDVLNSLFASLPTLMNIRMSLSNSTPTTTTDIRNAATLYLHPYNGSNVALWNTLSNKWEIKKFNLN